MWQEKLKMRAAVLEAPGQIKIAIVEKPVPGPGQVRIRMEGCGVCSSNLGPWGGMPWIQYPMGAGEMGHEGWGTIDALGDGVSDWRVGERVAAISYRAYAEYDVAPVENLVRLPEILEGQPFPGEALGCAMNIFERSRIRQGDTVAVIGIGFLGAVLTRLATHAGARVIAISRRDYSLAVAHRMGAVESVPLLDHQQIIHRVSELTAGRFCDVVIEAIGKQWPIDLAGELTRERGRLVIAGYHQDGPRNVNLQLWNWRGLDVVNAHERSTATYVEGIRRGIEAIEKGAIDPSSLYTHSFGLESLGTALDAVRDRPDGLMKAWVRLDGSERRFQ
jgi:threonine dehydrogenase-like Zn-dependent dehydrogenase